MISGFNIAANAFFELTDRHDKDEIASVKGWCQVILLTGCATSAFFGGLLLQMGRRNCIMMTDCLVIIGSVLCL